MKYNKNEFVKVNDKKVLHKVKKQWVTISIAMLGMLGLGAISYTSVSAHQTQQPATLASRITKNLNSAQGRKVPQDKEYNVNNPQFIDHQAKNLHAHLMRLSALSDDDNAKNNSQKTSTRNNRRKKTPAIQNHRIKVISPTNVGSDAHIVSDNVEFRSKSGHNYRFHWTAKNGSPILGPNGRRYQLFTTNGVHVYPYPDNSHNPNDIRGYIDQSTDYPIVNLDPSGNVYPNEALSDTEKSYNIKGTDINLAYELNNKGEVPHDKNGHPIGANALSVKGFPGEYVKIPYSDITFVKSNEDQLEPLTQMNGYVPQPQNSISNSDKKTIETEDGQSLFEQAKEKNEYPTVSNHTSDVGLFNSSDFNSPAKYLIYRLGYGWVNTNQIHMKYQPTWMKFVFRVEKDNNKGVMTPSDGKGHDYQDYSITEEGTQSDPFDMQKYLTDALNRYYSEHRSSHRYHVSDFTIPQKDTSSSNHFLATNPGIGKGNGTGLTASDPELANNNGFPIIYNNDFSSDRLPFVVASSDANNSNTNWTKLYNSQKYNFNVRGSSNTSDISITNDKLSPNYSDTINDINGKVSKLNNRKGNLPQGVTESDELETSFISGQYYNILGARISGTRNKYPFEWKLPNNVNNSSDWAFVTIDGKREHIPIVRYRANYDINVPVPVKVYSDNARSNHLVKNNHYSGATLPVSINGLSKSDYQKLTNGTEKITPHNDAGNSIFTASDLSSDIDTYFSQVNESDGVGNYSSDSLSRNNIDNLSDSDLTQAQLSFTTSNQRGKKSLKPRWTVPSNRNKASDGTLLDWTTPVSSSDVEPILRYYQNTTDYLPVVLEDQNGKKTYTHIKVHGKSGRQVKVHIRQGDASLRSSDLDINYGSDQVLKQFVGVPQPVKDSRGRLVKDSDGRIEYKTSQPTQGAKLPSDIMHRSGYGEEMQIVKSFSPNDKLDDYSSLTQGSDTTNLNLDADSKLSGLKSANILDTDNNDNDTIQGPNHKGDVYLKPSYNPTNSDGFNGGHPSDESNDKSYWAGFTKSSGPNADFLNDPNNGSWTKEWNGHTVKHNIPVIYYYRVMKVNIKTPKLYIGSDYQTSNYKTAKLNTSDYRLTDQFIPILNPKGTNANNNDHLFGQTLRTGSSDYPKGQVDNHKQIVAPFEGNPNGGHEIDRHDLSFKQRNQSGRGFNYNRFVMPKYLAHHNLDDLNDPSDVNKSDANNPYTPQWQIKYNGKSYTESDILNPKNWVTTWIHQSGKNATNRYKTANWRQLKNGKYAPILRYHPRVHETLNAVLGSDAQADRYTPVTIDFIGDASQSYTLSDMIRAWNSTNHIVSDDNGDNNHEKLNNAECKIYVYPHGRKSKKLLSDTINSGTTLDKNDQGQNDKANHEAKLTLSSDTLSDRGQKSDYGQGQKTSQANFTHKVKKNGDSVRVTNQSNRFKPNEKEYRTLTPSDEKDYNDKVNFGTPKFKTPFWIQKNGQQVPVLRYQHMITTYMPVILAPEPAMKNNNQLVYPTKRGTSYVGYVPYYHEEGQTHDVQINGLRLSDFTKFSDINSKHPSHPNNIRIIPDSFQNDIRVPYTDDGTHDEQPDGKKLVWAANSQSSDQTNMTTKASDYLYDHDTNTWGNLDVPQWTTENNNGTSNLQNLGQYNGQSNAGIPILRYLPEYNTPQMYQDQRYLMPKSNASDLSKYLDTSNDHASLYHSDMANDPNFVSYLDMNHHLNNDADLTFNHRVSSDEPYLYARYHNGHYNEYKRHYSPSDKGDILTSKGSIMGNLMPMVGENPEDVAFFNRYGQDKTGINAIEVGENHQPYIIDSFSVDNAPSDNFSFDASTTNYRFPRRDLNEKGVDTEATHIYSDLFSDAQNLVDSEENDDGYVIDNDRPSDFTVILNDGTKENIENAAHYGVPGNKLDTPEGVTMLFVTKTNPNNKKVNGIFPCVFHDGHYYAPGIDTTGDTAIADYSDLTPVDYHYDSKTFGTVASDAQPSAHQNNSSIQDNDSDTYNFQPNYHETKLQRYNIKYLNASGITNPSDLTESGPVASKSIVAPVGSSFHYDNGTETIIETDPSGENFAVACLNQSNQNKSKLYVPYKTISDVVKNFQSSSDWLPDSLDDTYNIIASRTHNGQQLTKDGVGNFLPEDGDNSEYNWKTSNQFTFNPNDPVHDDGGFYLTSPLYVQQNSDSVNDDNQKLQWQSNSTYGPGYLDANGNNRLNSKETNEIPVYVHPNPKFEVNLNINYINYSDNYKLGSYSTRVLDPRKTFPSFNVLSYAPIYEISDGDYVIDSTYRMAFHDPKYGDNQPVFKFVMAGDYPSFAGNETSLNANIYLSRYSPNNPHFYNRPNTLKIKYVDPNGKQLFEKTVGSGSKGKTISSDSIKDQISDLTQLLNSNDQKAVQDEINSTNEKKSESNTHKSLSPFVFTDKNGHHVFDNQLSDLAHGNPARFKYDGVHGVSSSDDKNGRVNDYYFINHGDRYDCKLITYKSDEQRGKSKKLKTWVDYARTMPSVDQVKNDYFNFYKNAAGYSKSDMSKFLPLYSYLRNDHYSPVSVTYGEFRYNNVDRLKNGQLFGVNSDDRIYSDYGFPDAIKNLANSNLVFDNLGSAFLRGTLVVTMRQTQSGRVNFIDEDNFHDETKHGGDGSILGNHTIGSIPIPVTNGQVNKSELANDINGKLNFYRNQYNDVNQQNGLHLQYAAMSDVANSDPTSQDSLTVNVPNGDKELDSLPLTLDHLNPNAMYNVILSHMSTKKPYSDAHFDQHLATRFVWKDGNGHLHDVGSDLVPSDYLKNRLGTQAWYQPSDNNPAKSDKPYQMYKTLWFNNGRDNQYSDTPVLLSDSVLKGTYQASDTSGQHYSVDITPGHRLNVTPNGNVNGGYGYQGYTNSNIPGYHLLDSITSNKIWDYAKGDGESDQASGMIQAIMGSLYGKGYHSDATSMDENHSEIDNTSNDADIQKLINSDNNQPSSLQAVVNKLAEQEQNDPVQFIKTYDRAMTWNNQHENHGSLEKNMNQMMYEQIGQRLPIKVQYVDSSDKQPLSQYDFKQWNSNENDSDSYIFDNGRTVNRPNSEDTQFIPNGYTLDGYRTNYHITKSDRYQLSSNSSVSHNITPNVAGNIKPYVDNAILNRIHIKGYYIPTYQNSNDQLSDAATTQGTLNTPDTITVYIHKPKQVPVPHSDMATEHVTVIDGRQPEKSYVISRTTVKADGKNELIAVKRYKNGASQEFVNGKLVNTSSSNRFDITNPSDVFKHLTNDKPEGWTGINLPSDLNHEKRVYNSNNNDLNNIVNGYSYSDQFVTNNNAELGKHINDVAIYMPTVRVHYYLSDGEPVSDGAHDFNVTGMNGETISQALRDQVAGNQNKNPFWKIPSRYSVNGYGYDPSSDGTSWPADLNHRLTIPRQLNSPTASDDGISNATIRHDENGHDQDINIILRHAYTFATLEYEDVDNDDKSVGSVVLKPRKTSSGTLDDHINYSDNQNGYRYRIPKGYYFAGYGLIDSDIFNNHTDVIYVGEVGQNTIVYRDKKSGQSIGTWTSQGRLNSDVAYNQADVNGHVPSGYKLDPDNFDMKGNYRNWLSTYQKNGQLIVDIDKIPSNHPNQPSDHPFTPYIPVGPVNPNHPITPTNPTTPTNPNHPNRPTKPVKPHHNPIKRPKMNRPNVPLRYRIVHHHNRLYLIVSRGPKVIRVIDLDNHRFVNIQPTREARRRLPQTNEHQVHTSIWSAAFATAAALIGGFGKAVDRRKH